MEGVRSPDVVGGGVTQWTFCSSRTTSCCDTGKLLSTIIESFVYRASSQVSLFQIYVGFLVVADVFVSCIF